MIGENNGAVLRSWWLHLVYIVVGAVVLSVVTVLVFAIWRYSVVLCVRWQRRRNRKRKIRPSTKNAGPEDEQQAALDAQMAAILGDVEDSSADEDMDDDNNGTSPQGKPKKKASSLKKWSKKIRKFFTADKASHLIGQHHGFTRDFLLRMCCAVTLFAGMIFSLAPYRVQQGFIDNPIVAWFYSVLMILIISHASFSLIAKDAPELSQYRSFDWWNPFYRVFYLLIFFVVDTIAAVSGGISTLRGGTGEETPQLVLWNRVTHAAALIIPLGIATGYLPQPNVFLSWAFEFMQVYFHGGTPTSSNARLAVLTCLSWLSTLCVFLAYYFGSASLAVMLAFGLGFMLSHDALLEWNMLLWNTLTLRVEEARCLLRQWKLGKKRATEYNAKTNSQSTVSTSFNPRHLLTPFYTYHWIVWPSRFALFTLSSVLILVSLGIGLALHFTETYLPLSTDNPANVRDIGRWISYGVEAILLVVFLLRELSRLSTSRYLFFNVLRNPMAPFLQRALPLRLTRIGFNIFMCILLSLYYIFFMDRVLIQRTSANWFAVFAESMLMVRCFRWTWLNTRCAYAELLVVAVLDKIPFGSAWTDFSFAAKLFFFGFAVHRLFNGAFVDRLRFMLLMYITPVQKKKYRFTNWQLVLVLNAVCAPCVLGVVLLSAFFVSPLLPLLGLPLFLIGSPRPLRMWTPTGASYNDCEDSAFYKDMEESVLRRLSQFFAGGVLMDSVQAGDMLMLRSEFFMVWVEIVERGFSYARVVFKGLELQTTSCHAEEATQLDGLVETVFAESKVPLINKHCLHTFRPVCSTSVKSFTLSNISLVGIIDQPDTFDHFSKILAQSMIWVVKEKMSGVQSDTGTVVSGGMPAVLDPKRFEDITVFPFDSYEIENADREFPEDWYQFIMSDESGEDENTSPNEVGNTPPPLALHPHLAPTVEDHVTFVRSKEPSDSDTTASALVTSVSAFSIGSDDDNDDLYSFGPSDSKSQPFFAPADTTKVSSNIPQMKTTLVNEKRRHSAAPSVMSPTKRWIKHFVLSTLIALRKASMGEKLNAFKIYEIYSGESFAFDSFMRQDPLLCEIFMTAFRYATYVQLEGKIYGLDEDGTDFDSLKSTLEGVSSTHSIRSAADHSTTRSRQVETFFTLEQEKTSLGNPFYKARYMKRAEVPFYVGKLNAEAVRSIWANLQQELFYFTNDDDERLSIQAMSPLLRNITISAAEPPLGYPIWNSVHTIETGGV